LNRFNPPAGLIIYEGPSVLNGEPIVMVATFKSGNRKTGNLIQTWILPSEQHPTLAIRNGDDAAVCGDCPHRGINGAVRSCYVNMLFGPGRVWRTYQDGGYASFTEEHSELFCGRLLRAGAYGDPVSVPYEAWQQILPYVDQVVSYTHLWRLLAADPFMQWTMASVDNKTEQEEAKDTGWRTYRVTDEDDLGPGEVWCPATAPGGERVQCEGCMGCDGHARGSKRVDFVAPVHGTGASHFRYWASVREDQRRGIKQLEIFDE